MKLTIVYDNVVCAQGLRLKSDWGFACLIETEVETILFDTGARGSILLRNMEKLSINPRSIGKIVLSHEHWDHTEGLKELSSRIDDVELYRLAQQSSAENIHLLSAEDSQEITRGVYSTGRLKGPVDEQSLVLQGKKGWYVLTGCSHPGVETILTYAQQLGEITGLIGGFHGFHSFSVLEHLDCICPCHCTKYMEDIQKLYPTAYVSGGVGKYIEI